MKKLLLVWMFLVASTVAAWAHCGTCGMGDEKKASSKSDILMQASNELQASNPELAAQLKEMAEEMSEHSHS